MDDFLERISKLSPRKLALLVRDLQTRLDSIEKQKREPIAIIGMGCRFPGGADSPEEFWRILHDGVDAISEVPPDRWDVTSIYDPQPGVPGKVCTRYGGFLGAVDRFDPLFFGISPREAASMDPQQRLLLEVAWEALENAGQAPEKLAGTKAGVFVGLCSNDYTQVMLECDQKELDMYHATGASNSIASGRISYLLGLHGPSMSLDTACSSSLVAVHLACLSLRTRECRAALAGGVGVMLSPEATIMFSRSGLMAKNGRCKTFDAAADGYVRGEGCGMVLLKRLSDAIADGDRILATIEGSAVNQDGRSGGITAPNGIAQQAVIREALWAAHVEPKEIDYVETHGTGTPLGDSIEAGALNAVFGAGRRKEDPLYIGSVKTNIGHAEGAAGVAGLIKLVLALQHKQLPPHLHLKSLNPQIRWDESPLVVTGELTPWRLRNQRRTGAVSSFGFSGTNAHIVISEAPEPKQVAVESGRSHHLLTVSAKSAGALEEMVGRYAQYLGEHPDVAVADVCHTANTGRSHFEHRVSAVAASVEQLRENLAACAGGQEAVGVFRGHADLTRRPEVVFLFTGQGGQYVNMGRALYESEPVFREVVDRCDELLRGHLEKPLREVLYPGPGEATPLDQTQYTHVAMFAVQYGLAQLWRSWGVEPGAVMGHSVGEIAASAVSGMVSLEDGLMLMRERGRLMHSLPATGLMASLLAGEEQVRRVLEPYRDRVAIAAINGPASTVISGDRRAVEEILRSLEAEGVKTRVLKVSNSFHSPLVEPVLEEFGEAARRASYRTPQLAQFSSMRLEWVQEGKLLDAAYWPYNLRNTVRFSQAMGELYEQGYRVFVEIGPAPLLVSMGSQCVPAGEGVWLPSLRQDRNDWEQLMETLGTMYVHGINPDWPGLDKNHTRRRLPLPTYAFQRERYAIEMAPRESRDSRTVEIRLLAGDRKLQTLAQAGRSLRAEWSESPNESGGGAVRLLDERNEVVAEIKGFPQASNPVRSNESEYRAELNDWLYEVAWEPQTLAQENRACSGGNVSARKWLIFADSHGIGVSLASSLRELGDECVVVLAEGAVADSTGAVFTVDPTRADQVQGVVQKIAQIRGSSWDGILHFWSLDCPGSEHLSVEALAKAQFRSCGSVLLLIQSLKEIMTTQPPRLWVITQGVQPAGPQPDPAEVAQAPVRGLCRVIAMEHPELRCSGVDLDPVERDSNLRWLLPEVCSATEEGQVAFRRGVRYVARLRRATFRTAPALQGFRQDGTYLITGGLGDLGMKVARWMAHAGAGQLVLMGRHAASTQAEELQRELRPAEVLVYEGDVARREDVAALLSQIEATMPPLRGIIHAAGVWEGGVLLQQDWNRFFEVLAPKVQGAWNLHELTQSLALDFFVSFSSGASVLGAAGLGDYASANSFLDALAHYRQAKGLPGSSINWGPWAGLGMVRSVTDMESQRWSEHGMGLIPPELALYALAQVIRQDTSQISVLPLNWAKLRSGIPTLAESTFIRELAVEGAKPVAESAARPTKMTLIAELLLVKDPMEQRQILAGKLQVQAARVLRLPLPTLDVSRPLNQFGLDSLMALELRNRMQAEWGIAIPLATILGGPSILQLATLAVAKLDGAAAHADRVPPDEQSFAIGRAADTIAKQEAQDLLRKLPELSDDDVDSILRRMVRP